ncbi:hypothetical protein GCM10007972_10010 [Iodidimonas muriae]|uniref:DUF4154 domain-containing protein n=1 Tax=Iodidimonas muriae TaxID=261467 RepID=A0ABQ2LD94_9PROT|nr:hypothetical protein [Iodidimonas muriae]GER08060.1 hypothetical protein JCM17843_23700 [Kordiimonadales bacterium JCM 17843]GGO08989.1 hypothetical protein GCM10007972_10010 [Iodidimonas muriae]
MVEITNFKNSGEIRRIMRGGLLRGTVAALLFIATPLTASATSEKDLQVAARALSFVSNMPAGSVDTAVLYDPANAASKSDAEAIHAYLAAHPAAGKAKLAPRLVAADDLSSLSSAKVAFIAEGASAYTAAIAQTAQSSGIVTLSSDLACVQGGHCVVGIASAPRVEIFVSRAAKDAVGASFASAFLMLVSEI